MAFAPDLVLHSVFVLYFSVRLLFVTPLFPPHASRHARHLRTLLALALAPILLPLLVANLVASLTVHTPFVLLASLAALSAALASLRFAFDAPLLQYATGATVDEHNAELPRVALAAASRMLYWRLDIALFYTAFFLSLALRALAVPPLALSCFLAAVVVPCVTAFDILIRARDLHDNAGALPLTLLRVAVGGARPHDVAPAELDAFPLTVFKASAFTLLTFSWIGGLIATGRQRPIVADDVTPMTDRYHASVSGRMRLLPLWQKQLRRAPHATPSLLGALIQAVGPRLLYAASIKVLNDICIFASPVLLRSVIQYLQQGQHENVSIADGVLLAFGLFLTSLLQSLFFQQYFNINATVEALMHGSLINMVYEKSCKLSPESRFQYTQGQIQNLMANDCRMLSEVVLYLHMIWSSVLQITIAVVLLTNLLGLLPTFCGIVLIVVCIPLQARIASTIKKTREVSSSFTDQRVKIVSEAIKGIKLVKMYAWETSFIRHILGQRALELERLLFISLCQSWNTLLSTSLPTTLMLAVFTCYVSEGKVLDAAVVFPAIALFNVTRPAMLILPLVVVSAAQAAAALSRLQKFFLAEELKPLNDCDQGVDQNMLARNNLDVAAINASLTWDPSISVHSPTLSSVSLQVPQGALVAIVGPTGAGKSSLLAAFLGEVPITAGRVGTREGRSVAFCDQLAFIQNATVRQNILFGKPFNEALYKETLRVCALGPDLKILPAADLTEIGGRGINLSGGQRARVSLARAVYARADIYMLDDPLSAVDAHVGKTIFDKCISENLAGKTRLLTTNQIHFAASPHVDMIVVVKHGTVAEFGERSALCSNPDSEFSKLLEAAGELGASARPTSNGDEPDFDAEEADIEEPEVEVELAESVVCSQGSETQGEKGNTTQYNAIEVGKLTSAETKDQGRVKFRHYASYFKSMGWNWVLPVICAAFMSQAFLVAVSAWLSVWSDQSTGEAVHQSNRLFINLLVFFLLGLGNVAAAAMTAFTMAFGSIRASMKMHEKLLLSVFGAPSSFFSSNPDGRIINRFNADLDKIDSSIASSLLGFLRIFLSLAVTIGLILWATPVVAFIAIPIALICVTIQEYYRKTSVDLRRLEALSRSPLYSHFAETLDGVVTIRAFKDVPRAIHTNNTFTDQLTRTRYATQSANRWLAFRLETCGTLLILVSTAFLIFTPAEQLSASLKGLILSFTLQIIGNITWSVRTFTDTESQMSSVERVSEYSQPPFPQEEKGGIQAYLDHKSTKMAFARQESLGFISEETVEKLNQSTRSSLRWPRKGKIEFRNVEMRYRDDLAPALRKVSFVANPGEHIGIVGRTGAGKSSAIQCLFRLYELKKGEILIDGSDISKMRLFDLRSALGVIPQEPVCFSGTIRSNLDMFAEYSDASVQLALDHSGLQGTMREKVTLDFVVGENGSNLSVGQRQLLCLGRALLKDSQILVLDEATSNISNDTDEKIQQTLRNEMAHCTILTVAHRLHTVMPSDRIIVMDQGRIVEMGEPSELLSRKSELSALVDETGPQTAAFLRQLANEAKLSKSLGSVSVANGHGHGLAHKDGGGGSANGYGNGHGDAARLLEASREASREASAQDAVVCAFRQLRAALAELSETDEVSAESEKTAAGGAGADAKRWREMLAARIAELASFANGVSSLDGFGDEVLMDANGASDVIKTPPRRWHSDDVV